MNISIKIHKIEWCVRKRMHFWINFKVLIVLHHQRSHLQEPGNGTVTLTTDQKSSTPVALMESFVLRIGLALRNLLLSVLGTKAGHLHPYQSVQQPRVRIFRFHLNRLAWCINLTLKTTWHWFQVRSSFIAKYAKAICVNSLLNVLL